MPRRIVLFTRDAGLTVALRTLLPIEDRVQQFESPAGRPGELDPAADTLVLDLPGELRKGAYRSIREWFSGRVVVLLVPGEQDRSFAGDRSCRVLFRPFQLDDLIRELVVPPAAAGRRRASPAGPGKHQAGGASGAAAHGPAPPGPPARPPAAAAPPPGPAAGPAGTATPLPGQQARPTGAAPPPGSPARPTGTAGGAPPPGPPAPPRAGAVPPPRPGPAPAAGTATGPPRSPDASRTRFPGGVDRPSRTASPGTPEKVGPEELDAAAEPDQPAARPLLFDWFAPHGRRVGEAAAEPPDNGTPDPTRQAPSASDPRLPPDRGQPPRPAQGPPAMPDLGRPTEPWRPLASAADPPAAGSVAPAEPRRPPGAAEPPPAATAPPADPPRPPTDLRRPGATPEVPAAKDPVRRVDPAPRAAGAGPPGAPGPDWRVEPGPPVAGAGPRRSAAASSPPPRRRKKRRSGWSTCGPGCHAGGPAGALRMPWRRSARRPRPSPCRQGPLRGLARCSQPARHRPAPCGRRRGSRANGSGRRSSRVGPGRHPRSRACSWPCCSAASPCSSPERSAAAARRSAPARPPSPRSPAAPPAEAGWPGVASPSSTSRRSPWRRTPAGCWRAGVPTRNWSRPCSRRGCPRAASGGWPPRCWCCWSSRSPSDGATPCCASPSPPPPGWSRRSTRCSRAPAGC